MMEVPERDDDGQNVTDQAITVPDGSRSPAVFTPEQVEAARAYAGASRAASTRAKRTCTLLDLPTKELTSDRS